MMFDLFMLDLTIADSGDYVNKIKFAKKTDRIPHHAERVLSALWN